MKRPLRAARIAPRPHHAARERGSFLVSGAALLSVMSLLVLAFLTSAVDSSRQTSHHSERHRLESAAESATVLTVDALWLDYERNTPGLQTLTTFKAYLDLAGVPDGERVSLDASSEVAFATDLEIVPGQGDEAGRPGSEGDNSSFAGVHIERIEIERQDQPEATRLIFTTTVGSTLGDWSELSSNARRVTVQESYLIEPETWDGTGYGLLANNVNCVMCHAEFDSAERVFNTEGAFGSYERVRVGSLESFQLRRFSYSSIAGTLFIGGGAYEASGAPASQWELHDIRSRAFGADGLILQDAWGDTVPTLMTPADGANPSPLENLYLSYGAGGSPMVDGALPDHFPQVFADDGGIDPLTGAATTAGAGNRTIDPNEFIAASQDDDGRVSGGHIRVVDPADVVADAGDLSLITTVPNTNALPAVTTGHVVLIGTETNPILLDGPVSIDGDLLIQGWVEGTGRIQVTGNVYLPSDLKYVDGNVLGNRTFGVSASGSENALSLAAGGNLLVGNLFHPRWGAGTTTGDTDGSFSFIMDEIAIFNRMEWTKTQPFLPGASDDLEDPSTYSVANANYMGEGYIPRYYAFTDGAPAPIFANGHFRDDTNAWIGDEFPGDWDETWLADPTDPNDPFFFASDGTPKAVLSGLTSTGGWMTDATLELMMHSFFEDRDPDEPLEIDAVLYSSNSIFGVIPKNQRMPSGVGFDGELIVNGSIIAADVGLLAPNLMRIQYDGRQGEMLELFSERQMSIRRELRVPSMTGHL